ncbi:MAG: hypothetical protein M1538_01505 [Candidatus Marsarchaeota archaeon]|nr:hypothetical protein [Candidatus Marsarchaeota archaeon]
MVSINRTPRESIINSYSERNGFVDLNNLSKDKNFHTFNELINDADKLKYSREDAIHLINNLILMLKDTGKVPILINSISDFESPTHNYIKNLIEISKNINNKFLNILYDFNNVEFSRYINIFKIIKNESDNADNFNVYKSIIEDPNKLKKIKLLFNNDFDAIIGNLNKIAPEDASTIILNSINILNSDSYYQTAIDYLSASKFQTPNIKFLLEIKTIEAIKYLFDNDIIDISDENILKVACMFHYCGNSFIKFIKYLNKTSSPFGMKKFFNSISINFDKDEEDILKYIIKKQEELGKKFDDISEVVGSIIVIAKVMMNIGYIKQGDYKEIDYLILEGNRQNLLIFEKNILFLDIKKIKESKAFEYIKLHKDKNITVKDRIDLLNKLSLLFRLSKESVIDDESVNKLIENLNAAIITYKTNNKIKELSLNNLIDKMSEYAPNASKYIKEHINAPGSIFINDNVLNELKNLISQYLTIKLNFNNSDIKINIDNIYAVYVENVKKKGKKINSNPKYEKKFLRDFKRYNDLAEINIENTTIKRIITDLNINKLILSKLTGIDESKIFTDKLSKEFINVIEGYINGSLYNELIFDNKTISNIKYNRQILRELIIKYYQGGNAAAIDYIMGFEESKDIIENMKQRGTNIDAINNLKLYYKISAPIKFNVGDKNIFKNKKENIIFYNETDIINKLNSGVYNKTCLNIINGENSFGAIAYAVDINNFIIYIAKDDEDKKIFGRLSLIESDKGFILNSDIYLNNDYKRCIDIDIIIDFLEKFSEISGRTLIIPDKIVLKSEFFSYDSLKKANKTLGIRADLNCRIDKAISSIIYSSIFGDFFGKTKNLTNLSNFNKRIEGYIIKPKQD